jgi:hypothetical protein
VQESASTCAFGYSESLPTILPNIQSQLPSSVFIVLARHTETVANRQRDHTGAGDAVCLLELMVIVVSFFLGRATDTASLPSLTFVVVDHKLYGEVNCMTKLHHARCRQCPIH